MKSSQWPSGHREEVVIPKTRSSPALPADCNKPLPREDYPRAVQVASTQNVSSLLSRVALGDNMDQATVMHQGGYLNKRLTSTSPSRKPARVRGST